MATRDGADDEGADVEVHVIAEEPPAPAAPRVPRRRTPNPVVDEVIHTGEIEARSHIIRSSDSMPNLQAATKVEIPPEPEPPTEPVTPLRAPARGARRRSALLVAAVAAAVVGGLLWFVDRGATPTAGVSEAQRLELNAVVQLVGATLDADVRAAVVRAEAMATSSMLRAAIETDAQTLADMARSNDVAFSVKPGELLEVLQIRDGVRTSLLRLPANGSTLRAPEHGNARIDGDASGIRVTVSAKIPSQQPDISGELLLAVPVDLAPIEKRITGHALHAELIGLAAPVQVVKGDGSGTKIAIPVETEAHVPLGLDITVASAVPSGQTASSRARRLACYACLGLAVALLIGFAALPRLAR